MILDTTSKSIQVVLSANAATSQAAIFASYADMTTSTLVGGSNDLASNNTTAVTAVPAPSSNTQRQVKHLVIYNADTVSMTVLVQLLDGATVRVLNKTTLLPGASLEWSQDSGFRTQSILTANTPDFISGAKMLWASASSISVSSGECWIPGANALWQAVSTLTLTGLALGNSAFGHVYAYFNAGVPAIECVTTAPSSTYFGTARTKTGDTSRRYLGSVLTDPIGNIYNFRHESEGAIYYNAGIDTFKVLTGNATIATTVACSSFVPVTGTKGFASIINNDTTHVAWLGNSTVIPSSSNYLELIGTGSSGTTLATTILLDSSQSFQYLMASGASANLVIRLKGYTFER